MLEPRRNSNKGDPILDTAIFPNVLAPDVCIRWQECCVDGGPCPLVDGKWSLRMWSWIRNGFKIHIFMIMYLYYTPCDCSCLSWHSLDARGLPRNQYLVSRFKICVDVQFVWFESYTNSNLVKFLLLYPGKGTKANLAHPIGSVFKALLLVRSIFSRFHKLNHQFIELFHLTGRK